MASQPRLRLTCIGICTLLLMGAPAAGQTPPADDGTQNAPSQFDSSKNKGRNLSEHLEKSEGVIKPPAGVDPEIHEKAPPTGDQGIVIHPDRQGSAPSDNTPGKKPPATPK